MTIRYLQSRRRTLARAVPLRRTAWGGLGRIASSRAALIALGCALLAACIAAPTVIAKVKLPRNALWAVVRTCVAMNDRFRSPFPCLRVENGPQGFAILRAPGSRTHLLVTPIIPVRGLEDSALRSSASPYWQAALDARGLVLDGAAPTQRQLGDVALAVNSRRSRSQDHLHIHVACAAPEMLRVLRRNAASIGPVWSALPDPIEDSIYWARRVSGTSAAGENIFVSLHELPNGMRPKTATVGAISLSGDGKGDFVQLASDQADSSAEDLLDTSCRSDLVR